MRDSTREYYYDRKCICGINQVSVLLINNKLPNNQRLLCDSCYQISKGHEPSIRYDYALREMDEKKQQKEKNRRIIIQQQIKPIEKLQQLLNSYKQDLLYEINSLESCVNEWIRIIQKIKDIQPQNNSFDDIYNLRCYNSIKDQQETLWFKHLIKHCNLQFCNKVLRKIQKFSKISKLQEGYQFLIESLFQIEPKIETNTSEMRKLLENTLCPLHKHPIIKVEYQNPQNFFFQFCIKCDNITGKSLDNFCNDWSIYLNNNEEKSKKFNSFLQDKMLALKNDQINIFHKINGQSKQAIYNLIQQGAIQLQKQSNHFEELHNAQLDLDIFTMITHMQQGRDFMQYNQTNYITIDQNPIKQVDIILQQQIQTHKGFNLGYIKIQDPTLYGPIQFKLISQCNNGNCNVIAFNQSKLLMITNQGNRINIYQLNNQQWERKKQVTKQNNELSITCIIHSKLYNSFVTADEKLVIWKYCDNIEVISQEQGSNKQNGYINCLIVNKNETQLFSGGKEIQIYQLNFQTSQIKYEYSLQEHQGRILSLSLNESETYMVSCCESKQIIVWKREERWTLMQIVNSIIQECSNRISFIRNDLFIMVTDFKQNTRNANRISFFKQVDNIFYEQLLEQLLLDYQCEDIRKDIDQPGFPIIQLNDHNIILIKNRNSIYTMRQQLDGIYAVLQNSIEFTSSSIFGNILYIPKKDQCYLIIWDQSLKTYQIEF